MRDVLFVLALVGFFAAATAYVRACIAIVGPDTTRAVSQDDESVESKAAA